MANTYTLIQAQTLASSVASVTFSSIPATYTDLVLRLSARKDGGGDTFKVQFNSDTATNYSNTTLTGNSSAASSTRNTSQVYVRAYGANESTFTANTFGSSDVYIPSYLVSQNKPIGIFGVTENNSAAADASFINASAGLWRNTAAITSIVITDPAAGNFVTGSSFYLYGIKNS
jgi:hypothetical protein